MKLGPINISWGEQKASSAGFTMVSSPGTPAWSKRDYKAFADEAYRKNVIAFMAISRIADAVACVDWEFWAGKSEVQNPALRRLWDRPNQEQSGPEFLRAVVSYYLIAGNAYLEKVTGTGREPVELWTLRPDKMSVIPGIDGMPLAYEYKDNGRRMRWDADGTIRHIKSFNPTDLVYGMSPVEAGAYAVDQHNEAGAWTQALLQNSAMPSGAITMPEGHDLGDEQFNRLKTEIEQSYSGARNAGRPMLLEGGMNWTQMGMSPKDMTVLDTKFAAARDIAIAFGVPPQMLGIPGDNTYSNYSEARLSFWEETVLPMIDFLGREVTDWLGADFGGVELRANIDNVPAIVEKRQALWQMADASMDLTINERRAIKGYDPLPDGDRLPMAQQPSQLDQDIKAAYRLAYG